MTAPTEDETGQDVLATDAADAPDQAGAAPAGAASAGAAPVAATEAGAGGRPVLTVCLAVFVVAVACAAWFGWSWYSAAHTGTPAASLARDRALADGEQAVQNFNTLDYRHVDQGINLWLQSSTGALHSQVLSGRTQFAQQVEAAKTITTARVLDGAVTALNVRAGTASVIVALQITVDPATGSPVVKQNRLQAQLSLTSGGWRLTEIGQVPTGASTTGG
jgi:Mce-associated membrane protein